MWPGPLRDKDFGELSRRGKIREDSRTMRLFALPPYHPLPLRVYQPVVRHTLGSCRSPRPWREVLVRVTSQCFFWLSVRSLSQPDMDDKLLPMMRKFEQLPFEDQERAVDEILKTGAPPPALLAD